jgi:hypothetical protein
MIFFIEKVHILRITHFFEATKDRNLIFGMGGDTNVKLGIQFFFYSRGSAPPRWGIGIENVTEILTLSHIYL